MVCSVMNAWKAILSWLLVQGLLSCVLLQYPSTRHQSLCVWHSGPNTHTSCLLEKNERVKEERMEEGGWRGVRGKEEKGVRGKEEKGVRGKEEEGVRGKEEEGVRRKGGGRGEKEGSRKG